MSGEMDGAIMAAAALIRLGWQERIAEYLPVEHFLPAVGQGALGIEIRANDSEMAELVSPLDHQPSHASILAERAFLRALGGGWWYDAFVGVLHVPAAEDPARREPAVIRCTVASERSS
jgi:porphobilinogen deaminase